jgi:hypothetical protein
MKRFTGVTTGTLALLALALVSGATGCTAQVGQGTESVEGVSQAVTTQSFTMSYTSWAGSFFGNGSCTGTSNNGIKGYEPTGGGTYPVFVFLTGTTMTFDGSVDEDLIQNMAGRGFVAATVQYDNSSYPSSCGPAQTKASCIYNTSSSSSAISKLCSRATADCANKGIYVSGFSQGANISSMAANYGSHMKAAYLIGNGDVAGGFYNLSGCLDKSHLTFTSSQLREVDGQSDQYFGNNQSGVQSQLQNVTGDTCASGTFNCLQADGSGWYIVPDSAVTDGKADHCYYYNSANSTCSSWTGFDTNWDTGSSSPWEKSQDLAWLVSK